MNEVYPPYVSAVFAARVLIKEKQIDCLEALKEAESMTSEQRMKAANAAPFELTWKELFLNKDVHWHQELFAPATNFVNKTYNNLFHIDNMKGATMQQVIEMHKAKKLPKEQLKDIEFTRTCLDSLLPIIVLTTDNKEFAIYDGWHVALACILEGKPIPALVGHAKQFTHAFTSS